MKIGRSAVIGFFLAGTISSAGFAQTARTTESLLTKMLRIAGITAAPSQLRGPADDVAAGNIWIVEVGRQAPRALTENGGYRSPIFVPNDTAVLALRSNAIVRLGGQGGNAAPVNAPGILKLVGIDPASPSEVVVLLESPQAGSPLATVSLAGGKVTPLPFDASSEPQRRMLAQIRAQERTYGDATVYTKTETKSGLARPIEWIDVYLKRGSAAAQNVSTCDGSNCVQPALSSDGRRVVFVKTDD